MGGGGPPRSASYGKTGHRQKEGTFFLTFNCTLRVSSPCCVRKQEPRRGTSSGRSIANLGKDEVPKDRTPLLRAIERFGFTSDFLAGYDRGGERERERAPMKRGRSSPPRLIRFVISRKLMSSEILKSQRSSLARVFRLVSDALVSKDRVDGDGALDVTMVSD